jgi:4-amino-4-deoxy-L-arabinose transferase-like glycosyltransferase
LGGILAVAAAVRALVALGLLGRMPLVSDARDYFDLGQRLAAGDAGGAFAWPPGESLLLAAAARLFGPSVAAARLLGVAIGTATVAVVMRMAREVAGPRAARAAGWMAALYPPSVLLAGQTYSQHLAALCLAAVALFGARAVRSGRAAAFAATGLALGLGCLTRPSMASVAPVVAAAWALAAMRGRAVARAAVVAAAVALACVVPACAHDARAGAGWTIATNNERNFFLGNNPYTPDYKTSHLAQRPLEELDPAARRYLAAFYARPDARAAMQRAALAYIAAHPARTALRTWNRAAAFWGFDYLASREIQKWRGWSARQAAPLLALEAFGYLAVAGLALVGAFATRGPWRRWLLGLALAYELPYALAFSGGTYHFPVMPLLMPLAAAGLPHAARLLRERRGVVAFLALAAFAALQAQYAYYAVAMR